MNILAYLLCCHCIGDGILQYHKMAAFKALPSWDGAKWCSLHVFTYMACFAWLMGPVANNSELHLQWYIWVAIGVQHWLQDRYSLHLKWMHWWEQTDVIRWPVGPLYVDQCWHIAFLMIFSLLN